MRVHCNNNKSSTITWTYVITLKYCMHCLNVQPRQTQSKENCMNYYVYTFNIYAEHMIKEYYRH